MLSERGKFVRHFRVQVGVYGDAERAKSLLESRGRRLDPRAYQLLRRHYESFLIGERFLDLVVCSGRDLDLCGNHPGPTTKQIFEAGKSHGFTLCPPEVGVALSLEYPHQPHGEQLRIAMPGVSYLYGHDVLVVGHDNNVHYLSVCEAGEYGPHHVGNKWVFVRPHK